MLQKYKRQKIDSMIEEIFALDLGFLQADGFRLKRLFALEEHMSAAEDFVISMDIYYTFFKSYFLWKFTIWIRNPDWEEMWKRKEIVLLRKLLRY